MVMDILPALANTDLRLAAALFDADFYHATYPDIREAGLAAFDHYLSHGWREGRKASRHFDTTSYLAINPDVARAGINPLIHYATSGLLEGRKITQQVRSPTDEEFILNAQPVGSSRVRSWRPADLPSKPIPAHQLQSRIDAAFAHGASGAVLSLSHDSYVHNVGGVQSVIMAEAAALQARQWVYLHVCPAIASPMLDHDATADTTWLALTINGQHEGLVLLGDLLHTMETRRSRTSVGAHLVVHHMMGFGVDCILDLARVCEAGPPIFWIHDFFALCVTPFLLRNDLTFCQAPTPGSNACMICNSGGARSLHIKAVQRIFARLKPIVLAASDTALDFWRSHCELQHSAEGVIPLATLSFGDVKRERTRGPLRVAHLGAAAHHKGWPAFERLVGYHRDDPRYSFHHLGLGTPAMPGVHPVPVIVTASNPTAMVDAVQAHEIDVVINWSICFETFSFVTLEALAGGAFVLARRGAGNVWPAIQAAGPGKGVAVQTEIELRALFVSGNIIEQVDGSQTRADGQLRRGSATAEVLLGNAHVTPV